MGFWDDFSKGFVPLVGDSAARAQAAYYERQRDKRQAEARAEELVEERAYQDRVRGENLANAQSLTFAERLMKAHEGGATVNEEALYRDDILGAHNVQGPLSSDSLAQARANPITINDYLQAVTPVDPLAKLDEELKIRGEHERGLMDYGASLDTDSAYNNYLTAVAEDMRAAQQIAVTRWPAVFNDDMPASEEDRIAASGFLATARTTAETKYNPMLPRAYQALHMPKAVPSKESFYTGLVNGLNSPDLNARQEALDYFLDATPEDQAIIVERLGRDPMAPTGKDWGSPTLNFALEGEGAKLHEELKGVEFGWPGREELTRFEGQGPRSLGEMLLGLTLRR